MLEHQILKYIIRSRTASIVFCLITLVFAASIFSISYPEYQRLGSAPLKLTIAQAIEQVDQNPWVLLTDAHWACDRHIKPIRENATFLQLSDPSDKNIIIADYSGSVSCLDKSLTAPTGTLRKMPEKTLGHFLRTGGLQAEQAQVVNGNVYWMCMYCGRGNSQLGIILAAIFAILSVVLYWLTEILRIHSKRPDRSAAKPLDVLYRGLFLIVLGVFAIIFCSDYWFFYLVPGSILGGLMCIGGLTIAALSKNKLVLDYFTRTNRKFMISLWGKDYFANCSLQCKTCGVKCNISQTKCHNCKAKL